MKTVKFLVISASMLILSALTMPASAHCDSFDGPALKDAATALETNNPELLKKWITAEQEAEVIPLFHKTFNLKKGDKEVYEIVKQHFFETFVRLHRETENAPYTGLKAAGTTKKITLMSDKALETGNADGMLKALSNHINSIIKEKFEKTLALEKVKNQSAEKGREFVHAYVDYTHSIEALHDIMEAAAKGEAAHNH